MVLVVSGVGAGNRRLEDAEVSKCKCDYIHMQGVSNVESRECQSSRRSRKRRIVGKTILSNIIIFPQEVLYDDYLILDGLTLDRQYDPQGVISRI